VNIKLGFVPLASGAFDEANEFSDGTIRLKFNLSNGSAATIIFSREEAEEIVEGIRVALGPTE